MQNEKTFSSAQKKFQTGYRWSFGGSLTFELSHIIHNGLLLYFLGASFYGLLGSLFSIVYLIINIANFGFESSVAPFLKIITSSQKSLRRVLPLYVLPQIGIILACSYLVFLFSRSIFFHPNQPIHFLFFFLLATTEGIRIFFRRFLHNIFLNKATILVEHIATFSYYAIIWGSFLCGRSLSLELIFIPYAFFSVFVIFIFFVMTYRYYKQLPTTGALVPRFFWRRILRARYYNSLISIEAFVISGNFLVPFFATSFGMQQAGLFKIANIAAHSIKALIKSIVHFPGAALLASAKTKAHHIKKVAFYTLSNKLHHIILFVIIFLSVNCVQIYFFYPTGTYFRSAWWYTFIFIGITLIHQLFVLYEQFYIIEEFAHKLFFIKSIEFILFYFLIIANGYLTPITTLINIGLIQILSFGILATHAYATWRIKPYFRIRWSFIVYSFLVSSLSMIIIRLTAYIISISV